MFTNDGTGIGRSTPFALVVLQNSKFPKHAAGSAPRRR